MAVECLAAEQRQLDLDGNKMNNEPAANNNVIQWDNGDETSVNQSVLLYIKNPTTPPETEAEEL